MRHFHDLELMVDGEAAVHLGRFGPRPLAEATGQRLKPPKSPAEDRWPTSIASVMNDVNIAIARTQAEYDGQTGIREVESLIKTRLRRHNAIFTLKTNILRPIPSVTHWRIGYEEQGPEVVIVLPLQSSGWLEQATMDTLRTRQMRTLREADRFNRLRICYPTAPAWTMTSASSFMPS
ncbi:MAG: hypothetical protein R3F37_07220 [Candidatus Competibacteraceae bacterium]